MLPDAATLRCEDTAESARTWRDLLVIAAIFAAGSAVYWISVLALCGQPGFPLDDSFIHLQFARNLYQDGQMAFNRGVPSSGSTAPAYPMLLAATFFLFRDWYLASFALGAVCSLGTAWLVYAILREWTGRPDVARWGGVLTVLISPTVIQAYGGMEAPVYSLLYLVGLFLYGRDRWRWAGSSCLAMGIWLRPEFMVFLPIICIERWIAWYRTAERRVAGLAGELAFHAALWSVVLTAYVAYNWSRDGHLLPTTLAAKHIVHQISKPAWLDGLPAAIRHRNPGQILLSIFFWPTLLLFLAGVALGALCAPLAFGMKDAFETAWAERGELGSARRLAILSLVGYPYLRGFVDTLGAVWFQGQRYYAMLTPLLVLVVLAAFSTTGAICRRPKWNWTGVPWRRQRARTYGWAIVGSLAFGTLAVLSVWDINLMQVKMAEWVRRHTRQDQLVATNDIGALAFLSERRILDTVGLVEPALVEHLFAGGELLDYLRRRDPAYVVIFPNWYEAMSRRTDVLRPEYSIRLPLNVVCGGSEFIAYRPIWADAATPPDRRVLLSAPDGG